jgi:hypothetical protein
MGSGSEVGRATTMAVFGGGSVVMAPVGSWASVDTGGTVEVGTTRTGCWAVLAIEVEAHAGSNMAAAAAARYPVRACIMWPHDTERHVRAGGTIGGFSVFPRRISFRFRESDPDQGPVDAVTGTPGRRTASVTG